MPKPAISPAVSAHASSSAPPSTNSRKRPHALESPSRSQVLRESLIMPNTDEEDELAASDTPAQKRSRRGRHLDLSTSRSATGMNNASMRSARSMRSHASSAKRRNVHFGKLSRFKEGSMHDRPSEIPPSIYVRDEDLMDDFFRDASEPCIVPPRADTGTSGLSSSSRLGSGSVAQQQRGGFTREGIYRFGKQFATAFNPVNIWESMAIKWKQTQEDFDPQLRMMKERRERAERTYAELKKNGQLATLGSPLSHRVNRVPNVRGRQSTITTSITSNARKSADNISGGDGCRDDQGDDDLYGNLPPHRDSGIDVDGYRSSEDHAGDEYYHHRLPSLLASSTKGQSAGNMSGSTTVTPRRSLFFKKPSLKSLKKSKSEMQLPSSRVLGTSIPPPPIPEGTTAATTTTTATPKDTDEQKVRKRQSKRDMQRQQRLMKKVSDLETKLQVARRELNAVLAHVPPVPPLPAHVTAAAAHEPITPAAAGSSQPNHPASDRTITQELPRSRTKNNIQPRRTFSGDSQVRRELGLSESHTKTIRPSKSSQLGTGELQGADERSHDRNQAPGAALAVTPAVIPSNQTNRPRIGMHGELDTPSFSIASHSDGLEEDLPGNPREASESIGPVDPVDLVDTSALDVGVEVDVAVNGDAEDARDRDLEVPCWAMQEEEIVEVHPSSLAKTPLPTVFSQQVLDDFRSSSSKALDNGMEFGRAAVRRRPSTQQGSAAGARSSRAGSGAGPGQGTPNEEGTEHPQRQQTSRAANRSSQTTLKLNRSRQSHEESYSGLHAGYHIEDDANDSTTPKYTPPVPKIPAGYAAHDGHPLPFYVATGTQTVSKKRAARPTTADENFNVNVNAAGEKGYSMRHQTGTPLASKIAKKAHLGRDLGKEKETYEWPDDVF
ncbi:hypothetical protein L228DRAFT_262659 [Xylona heveae TC161]|uniref:Uncharacterized protein n=1 Tax=Xylona heveae (strain CBS 132557 / TC161) TaxID=1328760 RepID=A0A165F9Z7_XYLHT|nr:hypothetical protein L228DRAFT_262659 [Xylona heveae TC161]KZF20751.1 hypothetical protein L228DRAFT_262659 [Xylona heveae TC161]